jgi:hypothetical protein
MKKYAFLLLFPLSSLSLNARQHAENGRLLAAGASHLTPAMSHVTRVNPGEGEPESALPTVRLQQSFKKLYPQANNATWAKLDNRFWVSFTSQGQKTTAVFRENGKLSYSITQLAAEAIPQELQRTIAQSYADYKLISATEINNGSRIVHQVILGNAANYVTMKKSTDELEVSVIKNASATR